MILVFKTICYRVYHISLFYLMFCKNKIKYFDQIQRVLD